jgi:hypothetical protein
MNFAFLNNGREPTVTSFGGDVLSIEPDLGDAARLYVAACLCGEVESTLAAACRWECRRRILATYSETDQTNSIRRALVLQRRLSTGAITDAELAEADALEQASNWIDAMTRHWQTIAAAGVSPFSDAAGWPNPPTP